MYCVKIHGNLSWFELGTFWYLAWNSTNLPPGQVEIFFYKDLKYWRFSDIFSSKIIWSILIQLITFLDNASKQPNIQRRPWLTVLPLIYSMVSPLKSITAHHSLCLKIRKIANPWPFDLFLFFISDFWLKFMLNIKQFWPPPRTSLNLPVITRPGSTLGLAWFPAVFSNAEMRGGLVTQPGCTTSISITYESTPVTFTVNTVS